MPNFYYTEVSGGDGVMRECGCVIAPVFSLNAHCKWYAQLFHKPHTHTHTHTRARAHTHTHTHTCTHAHTHTRAHTHTHTHMHTHTHTHTHTHIQTMTIPGTNTTVQFIFIDTILMCGTTDPTKRFMAPSGPQSQSLADEEWAWINETLRQSTADWIIMGGHYPGMFVWGTLSRYVCREGHYPGKFVWGTLSR